MPTEIVKLSIDPHIQKFLQTKMLRYISRIYDLNSSEDVRLDAFCKLGIIQCLLLQGEVGRICEFEILRRITDNKIKFHDYEKAWEVIYDYNRTGGVNVVQA